MRLTFFASLMKKKLWLAAVVLVLVFLPILFFVLNGTSNPQNAPVATAKPKVAEAKTSTGQTNISATSTTEPASTPTPASTPVKTPKPKASAPAQTKVTQLTFSTTEVSIHAGWDSPDIIASATSGETISGISKEWNDSAPAYAAMHVGNTSGKTIPFFFTTSITAKPGTYLVNMAASGSQHLNGTITVHILPPLFNFQSIDWDSDVQVFVIQLQVDPSFTGSLHVGMSQAPKGVPCAGGMFSTEQVDGYTYIWGCDYGSTGVPGSYPLTFSVSDGTKDWTKTVTWTIP